MIKSKVSGWAITLQIAGWENAMLQNGSFTQRVYMRKILINKTGIFCLVFLCIILNIYPQATNMGEDNEIKQSEIKLSELINKIKDNLDGTSVLENFVNEQEKWLEYRNSHISTLFPEYIDNIRMNWGSVISHEISKIILQMNLDRINTLENYLYERRQTGTDGEGRFKDYVNELKMIENNR
jgi:hypothetical protein